MSTQAALVAFAAATALHAGFQVTVTGLVYPGLARVPEAQWRVNHEVHSRLITPLVVLTYGLVLLTGAWVWRAPSPESTALVWLWVATGSLVVCFGATAAVAAPTHGRLAAGKQDALVRRLLWVDRVRALTASVAALAALAAALNAVA